MQLCIYIFKYNGNNFFLDKKIIFLTHSGYSYQVDKVNVGGFGGAPQCSRCSQRVYFNEEKRAIGKVWHTRCFTCGKLLIV